MGRAGQLRCEQRFFSAAAIRQLPKKNRLSSVRGGQNQILAVGTPNRSRIGSIGGEASQGSATYVVDPNIICCSANQNGNETAIGRQIQNTVCLRWKGKGRCRSFAIHHHQLTNP